MSFRKLWPAARLTRRTLSRRYRRRFFRPLLEHLELRRVLAVSAAISADRVLEIEGDSTGQDILLGLNASQSELLVSDLGVPVGTFSVADFDRANVLGLGGDDQLTVVLSDGESPVPGGITYDGGAGGFDTLSLDGPVANVRYEAENPSDGFLFVGPAEIRFIGLEPINLSGTAADLVFQFVSATPTETIIVSDTQGVGDDISRVDSSDGELVDFNNPTNSLSLETATGGGAGADLILLQGLDSTFDANVSITGDSDDTANFQLNPTDVGSGNLAVLDVGTIAVNAAVQTNGPGSVLLETAPCVTCDVSVDSSITTALGDITLRAGAEVNGGAAANISTTQGTVTIEADQISYSGRIDNGGGELRTLNIQGSSIDGVISGSGIYRKQGSGQLVLGAANTYVGGTFIEDDGTLVVNGSTATASQVTVSPDATLAGAGTVGGQVIVDGTVAPGHPGVRPPAILTTGQVDFNADSRFEVELQGTMPGAEHDQLRVMGSVTLGPNVTLSVTTLPGITPSAGDTFNIIDNDGGDAVSGTFANLAEGAIVATNIGGSGLNLVVSYLGGDGNDVVVSAVMPELTVAIAQASISENGGSTTATVTRNSSTVGPLTVTLSSTDPSEATVPMSVTILDGQTTSPPFTISAVDDVLLDGTQTVMITANAAGHTAGVESLDVLDHEILSVVIDLPAISENGGTTTATVARSNTDISSPVTVILASTQSDEATVPATVEIPANQSSATFTVTAVDDALLDGTQTATITAAAAGYVDGADSLDVLDHETLTVTIAVASVVENDGAMATTATVTRSNTDIAAPLVVPLTNGDTSEINIPATVTIPANQASVAFDIDAVDDALLDGTQTAMITASAAGYVDGADSLDVLDHETLTVTIAVASVVENDGAMATTATVTRSNTDIAAPLVVTLTNGDTSEINIPATVTIPANQASVAFDIDAVDDALLDGTQTAMITASAAGYVDGADSLDVLDHETLTVTIAVASVVENDGAMATTATVTRSNTDIAAPLVVTLTNGDTSEINIPATVTIPANQASVAFAIDAVDDALLDGTQTAMITASAAGYVDGADSLDVLDHETLTVTIAVAAVVENDGAMATTATVTRSNTDIAAPLVVTLTNGDTSEISIPATVTIPANQASVAVDIDAVDDAFLDGTQTAMITASAAGYVDGADSLDVLDHETLTVTIAVASVVENDGAMATTATVTRSNTDIAAPLVVTLTNGDTSEINIPATVTIPANQASVAFDIDAVDDAFLDGTQTAMITASAAGYVDGADSLDVLDHETLTVTIAVASVVENDGAMATTATVTRSNTDIAAPLVVTLTNGDTSEISIPATVTIPANQASVAFAIDAVDDAFLDGTQTAMITASAAGYVDGADSLDVLDHETLMVTIAVASVVENDGAMATTATVTRSNTDIAAPLVVTLTNGDTSEINIPATVTIPANQASVAFDIDAVDDALLDGTQTAMITASAAGYVDGADSLDVLDHETLTVTIAVAAVVENDGAMAITATVTRSNTDIAAPLVVTLTNGDTSEINIPATVTIPANQASVAFAIDAVDDAFLDGTQTAMITASAAGYVDGADSLDVLDHETLMVTIAVASVVENDGAMATTATVTRSNTDIAAPLVVTLTNGDTSEINIPGTVTIPANQASVAFDIDAVDDALLDGTQTAMITASAAGYVDGADSLDVLDHETLTVTIAVASVVENDGAMATTATVTRSNTDIAAPLVVTLTNGDTSEISIPATVTIPANQASVAVDIDAVDDAFLDGTQTAMITASAAGYVDGADSLDVLDHETLMVTIAVASVVENDGAMATTATVTRSNTDIAAPLVVTLTNGDTSEINIPGTVTIPANQASVAFDIDAVDDALLDGTQTAMITASAAGYVDGADSLDVLDHETLTVMIAVASVVENDGAMATTATVTRSNTDIAAPLVVTLTNGDTSEINIPATVTIPANQASVAFDIDAVDDAFLDGTQTAMITAAAAGYVDGADSLDVLDHETLTVTIAFASVVENDGAMATTATVTRSNTDIAAPLVVTLTNGDTSEINIPATVTIPANQASVAFDIDAVDDALLDGTQTAMITASAAGYVDGADSLDVLDHETLAVTIAVASVVENNGAMATTATVTRSNTDIAAPLVVTLTNGDTSEINIPATVTIPANQASVAFAIDAVDDALLDGTQTAMITASAAGYVDGADSLDVLDHETLTVTIAVASVVENDGAMATTATVTRSNTDIAAPLVVTLTNGDTSEISIPATVTIPANQASVAFDIDAVDDALLDGTQTAMITASAAGYVDGADSLDVLDHETLTVTIAVAAVVENDGAMATTATVTRSNTDIAAPLVVTLTNGDTSEINIPATVTIPANQASVAFDIDAVDDAFLDGTQTAMITASAAGYVDGADSLDVLDHETLMVTIAVASVVENDGAMATTATVTRSNTDIAAPLVVTLTNGDTSEINIPATVTIPANQASVAFDIDAVDDALLDGTQTAMITASAAGYVDGADSLDVLDHETLTVTIAVAAVVENDGAMATTATVTRSNTDIAAPLVVTLTNGDTSEINIPATVTIPANQASVAFDIDAVDDAFLDGTQTAMITASAAGYVDGADSLDVLDHETLTLLIVPASIVEGGGMATGTVTRSSSDDLSQPLTVDLISDDTTEATVPATHTIPAGQASSDFTIMAVNDMVLDGAQNVEITATSAGFTVDGIDTLTVTDNGTAKVSVEDVSEVEGAGLRFTVTLDEAVQGAFDVSVSFTDITATGGAAPLLSPTDYDNSIATLTFAGNAGETQQFTVNTLDDSLVEGSQTFTVGLTSSNALVDASDTATGTITDNDTATVAVDTAPTLLEDGGPQMVTVRMTTAPGNTLESDLVISVTAAAAAGTEAVDAVFGALGDITFLAGSGHDATGTVNFTVNSDTLIEGDEDVMLTLSGGMLDGQVTYGVGNITISDADTATVSVDSGQEVAEDGGAQPVTVRLTTAPGNTLESNLTIEMDAAAAAGTEDEDAVFGPLSGFTFAAGSGNDATSTISFAPNSDNIVEGDEIAILTPSGDMVDGQVTYAAGNVAILNDDSARLVIEEVRQLEPLEGTREFAFNVTLESIVEAGLNEDISVEYSTTGTGTADVDDDYIMAAGTLLFQANTAPQSQQFSVIVQADAEGEADETFSVILTSAEVEGRAIAVDETGGGGAATATIVSPDTGVFQDAPDMPVMIRDVLAGGKNDELALTIGQDGNGEFHLNIAASSTVGNYISDTFGNTVTVPLATTPSVVIELMAGDDNLMIDLSGAPAGMNLELMIKGGDGSNDSLTFQGTIDLGTGGVSTNPDMDDVEEIFINGPITTAGGPVMLGAGSSLEVNADIMTGPTSAGLVSLHSGLDIFRSLDAAGPCFVVDAGEAPVNISGTTGIAEVMVVTEGPVTLTSEGGIIGCDRSTNSANSAPAGEIDITASKLTINASASVGTARFVDGTLSEVFPLRTNVRELHGSADGLGAFIHNTGGLNLLTLVPSGINGIVPDVDVAGGGLPEGEGSPWQNSDNPLDVNNDFIVSPLDALLPINFLNSNRVLGQGMGESGGSMYFDVNGDRAVSPLDVLLVINHLNSPEQGSAEGEPPRDVERQTTTATRYLQQVDHVWTTESRGERFERQEEADIANLGPVSPIDAVETERTEWFMPQDDVSEEWTPLLDELAADVAEGWFSSASSG